MFIEQGVKNENKFWKYLLGFAYIIAASFVGQIPLTLAVLYQTFVNKTPYPTDEIGIMNVFESNTTLFLILITFVFVLAAVYFVVRYIHHQTFLSVTTSRPKADWNRILFSFVLWGSFTIVSTVLFYYLSPEDFVINFKPIPFLFLFIIATLLIPVQTSSEEYVFRAYLMQGFANLVRNKWFPLLTTSVIFGLMHLSNPEVSKMGYIIMVYYIGTGLFLGIITLMDEGIELALGFHAANNLIGALLVSSDWSALQTYSVFKDISEPSAATDIFLPVLIIYPVLLYIFSKKYNWKNWKEKLTGKIIVNN